MLLNAINGSFDIRAERPPVSFTGAEAGNMIRVSRGTKRSPPVSPSEKLILHYRRCSHAAKCRVAAATTVRSARWSANGTIGGNRAHSEGTTTCGTSLESDVCNSQPFAPVPTSSIRRVRRSVNSEVTFATRVREISGTHVCARAWFGAAWWRARHTRVCRGTDIAPLRVPPARWPVCIQTRATTQRK